MPKATGCPVLLAIFDSDIHLQMNVKTLFSFAVFMSVKINEPKILQFTNIYLSNNRCSMLYTVYEYESV